MTARSPDLPVSRAARRAATASLIGTTIEWYDFFIYGSATALVFAHQFFPESSAVSSTLAAYTTFAVGFLARPLGGIVMGHFGDRIGRKRLLVWSLLTMGFATCATGLLPGYATIGGWAPVLLVALRLVQGFAVGGEWGGAVLIAVEHAPRGRRGLFGAFPQLGVPLGTILSSGVFLVVSATMSEQAFLSWGWRIPFLLSAVLIVLGLVLRRRLEESPEFAAVRQANAVTRSPVRTLVQTHRRALVLCGGGAIAAPVLGYLMQVYALDYGTATLHLSSVTMLALSIVGTAVALVAVPAFATLSDRVGRRRVFLCGAAATTVWAVPLFLLAGTGSIPLLLTAFVVGTIGNCAMTGAQAALFAESFAPEVRYSGASLSYQAGSVLGGAVAPIVATALYAATGTSLSIGLYLATMGAISFVSVLALGEPQVTGGTGTAAAVGEDHPDRMLKAERDG